jgi:hypothetical protein
MAGASRSVHRTFFHLDPPYHGYKVYRHNFRPEDFEQLAAAVALLRGKFFDVP